MGAGPAILPCKGSWQAPLALDGGVSPYRVVDTPPPPPSAAVPLPLQGRI